MQPFKTQESSKAAVILIVGIVVVIMAIVLFKKFVKAGEGVLEGLNLKDDKNETANKTYIDDKVNKSNASGSLSAWSPVFYKNQPGALLFTQSKTDGLIKQIWDSVGYLFDSPNVGAGAIKQCRSKSQVSWLADNFQKKYGSDLLTWLQDKYDTSEQKEVLADILRYVDNLPKYKA